MTDIPAFLDRRPIVWSYSLLHCFRDVCAHQGQARYIDKTIKFVETPEIKNGNEGHEALELRVGAQKPLPLKFADCEPFAAPFDGRGAITEAWYYIDTDGRACDRFAKNKFGHGKLDLVLMQDDTAYLNDWKFGNSKYEDPFELEIGALLLHAKYPHLKTIKGTYTWLKEKRLSKMYDLSDTQKTWTEACTIMNTILNYRQLGEFPKKRSGLCGWCQRWDCDQNTNSKRPA